MAVSRISRKIFEQPLFINTKEKLGNFVNSAKASASRKLDFLSEDYDMPHSLPAQTFRGFTTTKAPADWLQPTLPMQTQEQAARRDQAVREKGRQARIKRESENQRNNSIFRAEQNEIALGAPNARNELIGMVDIARNNLRQSSVMSQGNVYKREEFE